MKKQETTTIQLQLIAGSKIVNQSMLHATCYMLHALIFKLIFSFIPWENTLNKLF